MNEYENARNGNLTQAVSLTTTSTHIENKKYNIRERVRGNQSLPFSL